MNQKLLPMDNACGVDASCWPSLQDFTVSSDIDRAKPISDIDRQLYAKYDLTEDEQHFIESMIKPME